MWHSCFLDLFPIQLSDIQFVIISVIVVINMPILCYCNGQGITFFLLFSSVVCIKLKEVNLHLKNMIDLVVDHNQFNSNQRRHNDVCLLVTNMDKFFQVYCTFSYYITLIPGILIGMQEFFKQTVS